MNVTALVGIIVSLVITPSIVFGFIFLSKRAKYRVEELRFKKEILELEIKKDEMRIYTMHEENKKLDRIINRELEKLE